MTYEIAERYLEQYQDVDEDPMHDLEAIVLMAVKLGQGVPLSESTKCLHNKAKSMVKLDGLLPVR